MATDPKFDARNIWRKYARILKKSSGFDGGDISVCKEHVDSMCRPLFLCCISYVVKCIFVISWYFMLLSIVRTASVAARGKAYVFLIQQSAPENNLESSWDSLGERCQDSAARIGLQSAQPIAPLQGIAVI